MRIDEYDRLIHRLRNHPRFWDKDDRVHRILIKALSRRNKLRLLEERIVGPYSGLTRAELSRSGTCETDWF